MNPKMGLAASWELLKDASEEKRALYEGIPDSPVSVRKHSACACSMASERRPAIGAPTPLCLYPLWADLPSSFLSTRAVGKI